MKKVKSGSCALCFFSSLKVYLQKVVFLVLALELEKVESKVFF